MDAVVKSAYLLPWVLRKRLLELGTRIKQVGEGCKVRRGRSVEASRDRTGQAAMGVLPQSWA